MSTLAFFATDDELETLLARWFATSEAILTPAVELPGSPTHIGSLAEYRTYRAQSTLFPRFQVTAGSWSQEPLASKPGHTDSGEEYIEHPLGFGGPSIEFIPSQCGVADAIMWYTPGHIRMAAAYFSDPTYARQLAVAAPLTQAYREAKKALLAGGTHSASLEGAFRGPYVTIAVRAAVLEGAELRVAGHRLLPNPAGTTAGSPQIEFDGWNGWHVSVR